MNEQYFIPDNGIKIIDLELVVYAKDEDVKADGEAVKDSKDTQSAVKRKYELEALEQQVAQLNSIYTDLHELVAEQQQSIDAVAVTTEIVKVNVIAGTIEIQKAKRLQISAAVKVGMLATIIGGPLVGIIAGLKFGLVTTAVTGLATMIVGRQS